MSDFVSLVLVSHSRLIAEGTRELAQEMAPEIHIGVSGGNPDGGLGSSFDMIEAVVGEALRSSGGRGVAILTDMGSTTLTVDSVIEMAEDPSKVRLAFGPLVEGAVAAAVAASQGEDLDTVVRTVAQAATSLCREARENYVSVAEKEPSSGDVAEVEVRVGDPGGLHARSAAMLARKASSYDAVIHVDDALATSVVDILSTGIAFGDTVTVRVEGEDAPRIADEISKAIADGFDEAPRQAR